MSHSLLACSLASLIALNLASTHAMGQDDFQELNVNSLVDQWTAQTGIVITAPARKELVQTLAQQLREKAPQHGFSDAEAKKLSRSLTIAEALAVHPDRIIGTSHQADTWAGITSVPLKNPEQWSFVSRLMSLETLWPYLKRYPLIKVVVDPMPPRDYKVEINGKFYPATEQSLYGVPDGSVSVRVLRENKPPCIWNGIVEDGEDQTLVSCHL